VRRVRSGLAVEYSVDVPLHRAAQGMPCAGALLSVVRPSISGQPCLPLSGEVTRCC